MSEATRNDGGEGLSPGVVLKCALAAGMSLATVWLLVFLPAGTLDFWQAWAYLGLFILYFAVGTPYFLRKSPDLIRRRLRFGPGAEEEAGQKIIMSCAFPALSLLFLIPGFDRRFAWSSVPSGVSILCLLGCLAGMAIAFYATAYNQYVASIITVERDQPVIASGPYARVRHPLYAGIGLWFFLTPLALGSWWGMLAAPLVPALLIVRLVFEERSLRERLPGYVEYCRKVRWRLIPGVF